MKRFLYILILLLYLVTFGFSQVNSFFPSNFSIIMKFKSFGEFSEVLTNFIKLNFGSEYLMTLNSVRIFLSNNVGTDILEISNLLNLEIDPDKEFAFGFNDKGQPFFVLHLMKTNGKAFEKLKNLFFRKNFMKINTIGNLLFASGNNFQLEGTLNITNEFNVLVSRAFFESVLPIFLSEEYKDIFSMGMIKVYSNIIDLNWSTHLFAKDTNVSSFQKHYEYLPFFDSYGIVFNSVQSPLSILMNLSNLNTFFDIGIFSIFDSFRKLFGFDISKTGILSLLLGDTTLAIYSYLNGENNKVFFVSSTTNQKKLIGLVYTNSMNIAKSREVFRFTIFDKEFYKFPVTSEFSLYVGVIFNRFMVSTDKDILISFVRNLAKEYKEYIPPEVRSKLGNNFISFLINSQPFLDKVLKIKTDDLNWVMLVLLPTLMKSKMIMIYSNIEQGKLKSKIEVSF